MELGKRGRRESEKGCFDHTRQPTGNRIWGANCKIPDLGIMRRVVLIKRSGNHEPKVVTVGPSNWRSGDLKGKLLGKKGIPWKQGWRER